MKKGFTLIELLAVIVILAIIALIATPIILGIINDAREESNERSAELYASAVRNAIASYQLTNPNAPTSFSELDIEHDGNVVCETEELYADGSFYIADCTVNGDEVEYTYGTKQEKPLFRYYSWSSGTIGENLPNDVKTNASEIDTKGNQFYIGLDADSNNKVITAYVCFVKNNTEYCLKGNDTEAYITNNTVLLAAYGESGCDDFDNSLENSCNSADLDARVGVYSNGMVYADNVDSNCQVNETGQFRCDKYE